MRFALVTTSLSVALIVLVSAIAIAALSWIYSSGSNVDASSDPKVEILWGQGS